MKKSINERYFQTTNLRNDIFRKFEKQFKYCFLNPISISENLYVEQKTDEYQQVFDVFLNSTESDIKFFVGYTGVGKTTFIKHYFGHPTMGAVRFRDGIIIPNSWDGRRIPDQGYSEFIDMQISNIIDNLIKQIYKSYEELVVEESSEIIKFIEESRPDILFTLSIEEIIQARASGITANQFKLQKSKNKVPVEFSCSLLKYVITNHNEKREIKRLIFVVDDLETLSQPKLSYIIDSFFKIYACMHNNKIKTIVNLLISLRPHSFRFLRNDIEHRRASVYGNYLQLECYRLIKNDIPDIKEIFISRFENAIKNTPKPGNPNTWEVAKRAFYDIIYDFDDNLVAMISDLCHMNIRAVTDCFQMILSNRVWCQEFDEQSEYPNVRKTDYRFDVVNVIRTLACGENAVYTGREEIQFNPNNMMNVQSRPSFDDSKIFIPNLLVNLETQETDPLSAIIMQYLDGYFSSSRRTLPQTEFITKKKLCDDLYTLFCRNVDRTKIDNVINYLFENRILRKSIISKDSDTTLNMLHENDHVYLTLKGSRLLSMLESDSVLLEVYREDIKRNYQEDYYKSSLELISENNRFILFDDLINLANELYESEDQYQRYIVSGGIRSLSYDIGFPITLRILTGVERSLLRSQNMDNDKKRILNDKISELQYRIENRISELKNSKQSVTL